MSKVAMSTISRHRFGLLATLAFAFVCLSAMPSFAQFMKITAPSPTNEGSAGTTPFAFTVQITGGAASTPYTVDFDAMPGTTNPATSNVDFLDNPNTVNIATDALGNGSATIIINVVADTRDESDFETFDVVLTNPSPAITLQNGGRATATILDDDAAPTIAFASTTPSITEGDTGSKTLSVGVTLSAASDNVVSFTVNMGDTASTTDSDATAGVDYDDALSSTTVTINAGSTLKTLDILIPGDISGEGPENFAITLSSVINATPGTLGPITATILDNDVPHIDSVTPTFGPVGTTVTATGTKLAGTLDSDTTVKVGGINAIVTAVSDTDVTFIVPSGATGNAAIQVITPGGSSNTNITFQVAASIKVAAPTGTTNEGSTVGTNPAYAFTFTLSGGAPSTTYKVAYSITDGTVNPANLGTDYSVPGGANGTVTFVTDTTGAALAQSVTFNAIADTTFENDETLDITLGAVTGNVTVQAPGAATATIINDDNFPSLSVSTPAALKEEDSGTQNMVFVFALSAKTINTVSFDVDTAPGVATPTIDAASESGGSADYSGVHQTFTIAPGVLTTTVNVPVNGDIAGEKNEIFNLNVSGITNASPTTLTSTGTIADDDAPTIASIKPNPVSPGNSETTGTIMTILGDKLSGIVSVKFNAILALNVTVVDDTELTVEVPQGATSGTLTVTTGSAFPATATYEVGPITKASMTLDAPFPGYSVNENDSVFAARSDGTVPVPFTFDFTGASQADIDLNPTSKVTFTITAKAVAGSIYGVSSTSLGTLHRDPSISDGTTVGPSVTFESPKGVVPDLSNVSVSLVDSGDDNAQGNAHIDITITSTSADGNYNATATTRVERIDPHRTGVMDPSVEQSKTSESDVANNRSSTFQVSLFSSDGRYSTAATLDNNDPALDGSNVPGDAIPNSPVFVTIQVQGSPNNPAGGDEALISTDTQQVPAKSQILVFSPTSSDAFNDPLWYTKAQNVYVHGVDDPDPDGDQEYQIAITNIDSRDEEYLHLGNTPAQLTGEKQRTLLTNIDDEAVTTTPLPGVIIKDSNNNAPSAGSPLNTAERGDTQDYFIKLNSQPTANVDITFTTNRPDEGKIVDPANASNLLDTLTLTFTPTNWNNSQKVTVKGIDDQIKDGDVDYNINTTLVSSDVNYGGNLGGGGIGNPPINPIDLYLTNLDDETTGLVINPPSAVISEGGSGQITVRLNQAPTQNVFVDIDNGSSPFATIDKTRLTFTSTTDQPVAGTTSGWNVEQIVTVDSIRDDNDNQTQTVTVSFRATSIDTNFNGATKAATVTILNDLKPGVIITPLTGLQTSEDGAVDTFTVQLTKQPTSNVTIPLATGNSTEGKLSDPNNTQALVDSLLLTFTPTSGQAVSGTTSGWNTPQTIQIKGVNDDVADGLVAYLITTGDPASTGDAGYNALTAGDIADVSVTNTDNDSAGIGVTPTNVTTNENGNSAPFNVVLNTKPLSNVTIDFVSSNTGEATLSPASITFTPVNWNIAQTIVVTGVDDSVFDGPQPYTITGTATSADSVYDNRTVPTVNGTNNDNEAKGVTVTPTSLVIVEGNSDTFTIALNQAPTKDVFIDLDIGNSPYANINKIRLQFTPTKDQPVAGTVSGWNVAQTITVNTVLLPSDSAKHTAQINFVVSSADGNYDGLPITPVSVQILNNPAPVLTISSPTVLEGTGGTQVANFVVTFSTPSTSSVTFTYQTQDGTGPSAATVAGGDYVADGPTTITVPPNTATYTIPIIVNSDAVDEVDETFSVMLSSPVNAFVIAGSDTGTATITDDDGPTITIDDVTVDPEGAAGVNTSRVFTVTLSAPSVQTVTADYTFAPAAGTSAAFGVDYTGTNGTLTFQPGEDTKTIPFTVVGDGIFEGDENFLLNLSNVSITATVADGQGLGTIVDDDNAPTISIQQPPGSIVEPPNTGDQVDAQFTVKLSNPSAQDVTVDYQTVDDSAFAPGDYDAISITTLTIPAGSTTAVITVKVNGNNLAEGPEKFQVILANALNATIGTASADGNIQDTDPTPSLTIADASVAEGDNGSNNVMTFTVTLSALSERDITVDYATQNGGTIPASSADYVATTGTLVIGKGNLTKTFDIPITGDPNDEPNETFLVKLSNAVGATIAAGTATGTINDDDALPLLTIGDKTVTEGDTNNVTMSFQLTLTPASDQTVTVNYATAADATATATPGKDYVANTGLVTFAPGETSKFINITVLPDRLYELNETLFVDLSTPSQATLGNNRGIGTIIENDAVPAITIDDAIKLEGNANNDMLFDVKLSVGADVPVSVIFSTSAGTATSDVDYTRIPSTTLTFAPGETAKQVAVTLVGDTVDETSDETFFVNLSSPSNATISDNQAQGTIIDDDGLSTLTVDSVTVTEGDITTPSAIFTITLSAATNQTVRVFYQTVAGSAGNSDYTPVDTFFDFVPGALLTHTVAVPINDDSLPELVEKFTLRIVSATNANIDSAKRDGVGTINDNDAKPPTITGFTAKAYQSFGVTPSSGVTISGTDLLQTQKVTFAGPLVAGNPTTIDVDKALFTAVADGAITVPVPDDASTGKLKVTTLTGTATTATDLIVQPVITEDPDPLRGAIRFTTITITGKHFLDPKNPITGVKFGGVPVDKDLTFSSFIIVDDTTIRSTIPEGAPSSSPILIETKFGGDGPPGTKPVTVDPVTKGSLLMARAGAGGVDENAITNVPFVLHLAPAIQQDPDGTIINPVGDITVTISMSVDSGGISPQFDSGDRTTTVTFPSGTDVTDTEGANLRVVYLVYAGDDNEQGNKTITVNSWISASNDPNYPVGAAGDPTLTTTVTRIDRHGFSADTNTVLRTSELGQQATFFVTLNDFVTYPDNVPKSDVLVKISTDAAKEGLVSTVSQPIPGPTQNLLFSVDPTSPDYYQNPHQVTVTGVDDTDFDGDQIYHVVMQGAFSGDAEYNGLGANGGNQVTLVNVDNEANPDSGQPGVQFNNQATPPSGLFTNENGATAVYTVRLATRPSGQVTLNLASDDPREGKIVDPNNPDATTNQVQQIQLIFLPDDPPVGAARNISRWDKAQQVTIKGQDDTIKDGDLSYHIVTSPDTANTFDTTYGQIRPPDVVIVNNDNEQASVTVSPIALVTPEGTTLADNTHFTVVLNQQPTADVFIKLNVLKANGKTIGAIDRTGLTFSSFTDPNPSAPDPANYPNAWNVPQTIKITTTDDLIDNVDQTFTISLEKIVSADLLYNGIDPANVDVTNLNNDTAGYILTPSSGLITNEAGLVANYTVRLTSQPTDDVTLTFTTSNVNEGQVSPSALVFTPSTWDLPQTVTVTGQDDAFPDGDVIYRIISNPATSNDGNYNSLKPPDEQLTNQDNDVPGYTITPTSGLITTENGDTANFTVHLNSQPTSNVTVAVSSTNTNEGTVAPSSLVFTPGNWNTAQTVIVTGVDDAVRDGNQAYQIALSATSVDVNYGAIDPTDVDVTNRDNDQPGFTVSPTTGLLTTEAGAQSTFRVVLTVAPTASVILPLSVSDNTEASLSATSLTFTTANWNVPQTVTVTGLDDALADGDQPYTVITGQPTSTDPNYAALTAADVDDVSLTNKDDDTVGILVTPTTGLTTSESGGTATFTVKLRSQPTADVTFDVSSSNTGEGTVKPPSLTFTPSNWNTPQTVTVTGADDTTIDGDITFTIVTGIAISADSNYNGFNPSDVSVVNRDNDNIGFNISPTSGLVTSEDGDTATFGVVLKTAPTADVTLPLSVDVPGEGRISATSLIFTTANWNVPQFVTVTGVDDQVADGPRPYQVVTGKPTSSDPNYAALQGTDVIDISVTNNDNDTAGYLFTDGAGAPLDTTPLITSEDGTAKVFFVRLRSMPTSGVTIDLTSSNTAEGTVAPATLTFDNSDWNVPHQVTVTGVDDYLLDGPVGYKIFSAVSSADLTYNALKPQDVLCKNEDDETSVIVVTPRSGLMTDENGEKATFKVVLARKPNAGSNVRLRLASSNTGEGTIDASSLTFDTTNWNTPQIVTITGVKDTVADGDQNYQIRFLPAISTDPNFDKVQPPNVDVINIDTTTPGVTVTPTSGLVTTEAGGTAIFTVKLNSQPTADVVINLSSSDTNEGTVAPATLTFTSTNYNTLQTVTVTGVDDVDVHDGDKAYTIVTSTGVSTDTGYNNLAVPDVDVVNVDDDVPGVTVTPTTGLVTNEDGGTATFTVVLTSKPKASVTIGVSSSDATEGKVSPSSLTFDANNWNTAQTVTVTGVADNIVDNDQAYQVVLATATSADADYSAINPNDVDVVNLDNGQINITITPLSLTVSEAATPDTFGTFDVKLNLKPSSDVMFTISSDNLAEGTVDKTSLTFTPANYSTPQTVEVRGVPDNIDDGNTVFHVVTGTAVSSDPNYGGLVIPDVTVTNTDIDEAGFSIVAAPGLETTETGDTATFTVRLTSIPSGDVTLKLRTDNAAEGKLVDAVGNQVDSLNLVFTAATWDQAQTVTVKGQDELVDDGDVTYNIITDPATSSDNNYQGNNASDVALSNVDNDTAGFTIEPTANLTTSETGGRANFTVKLNSKPLKDVAITLKSDNENEGRIVNPTTDDPITNNEWVLTFTSANWDTPQTVTVQGIADGVDDGDKVYHIETAPAVSDDAAYTGKDADNVAITNLNIEHAEVIITPTGGLRTEEKGTTTTFKVKLGIKPSTNVTYNVASQTPAEGVATPAQLFFTPTNFGTFQTVTVRGVDDAVDDGNVIYFIKLTPTANSAPEYLKVTAPQVQVINVDDDNAGVLVGQSGRIINEGESGKMMVKLASKPKANVTIPLASSDTNIATLDKTQLVFTPANFNIEQAITITTKRDNVMPAPLNPGEPPRQVTFFVQFGEITSTDLSYSKKNPTDVQVLMRNLDAAAIDVTPTEGLKVTEAAGAQHTASFKVVLKTKPISGYSVVIPITSSRTDLAAATPAYLTFTKDNWNIQQTVTITGVENNSTDGPVPFKIVTGGALSSDPNYKGKDPADVSITAFDNDVAKILTDPAMPDPPATPTPVVMTETGAGSTKVITVKLATKPVKDVRLKVTSSNTTTGGTVSTTNTADRSLLIFTQADWFKPHQFTVQSVDDQQERGVTNYQLIIAFSRVEPADANDNAYGIVKAVTIPITKGDSDDDTPPVLTIANPAVNGVYKALASANGTINDVAAAGHFASGANRVTVRLTLKGFTSETDLYWNGTNAFTETPKNNEGTVSGGKTWNYPLPVEKMLTGRYNLTVNAFDKANNVKPYSVDFFIDKTPPPSLIVTAPTANQHATSFAQIAGTANDSALEGETFASGLARIEFQLVRLNAAGTIAGYFDGTTFVTTTRTLVALGTTTWNYPLPSDLAVGKYQVAVAAVDKAGNTTKAAPITFIVDAEEGGGGGEVDQDFTANTTYQIALPWMATDNAASTATVQQVFNLPLRDSSNATNFQLSRFNPLTQAYEEITDPTTPLTRGVGYFLKTGDNPLGLVRPATSTLKPLAGNTFTVILRLNPSQASKSFNMIGFPFDPAKFTTSDWANAEVTAGGTTYSTVKEAAAAGVLSASLFTFDAASGQQVTVNDGLLRPLKGYFVQTFQDAVQVKLTAK